jgi:D-alanyl-lipoteichoic acid acyltransferase DltB (MBOAT superfamily)
MRQILWGLFKKIVIADNCAEYANLIFNNSSDYSGSTLVFGALFFTFQIYGDFSGYTDIAIGISRLMGFELLPNFNSPYKANSVADFWRRWHKSLGSWLRDYLYIPLGGNRKGGTGTFIATTFIFVFLFFILQWYAILYIYAGVLLIYALITYAIPSWKHYINRDLNLLITMVVGGLWHGASENFIIWGTMNGVALIVYNHWKQISPYEHKPWLIVHFWKVFLTFNFITPARFSPG